MEMDELEIGRSRTREGVGMVATHSSVLPSLSCLVPTPEQHTLIPFQVQLGQLPFGPCKHLNFLGQGQSCTLQTVASHWLKHW